ncbi:MAG: amylo-alpha-1,6-glucosidase, partial [Tepidisphaeraceae bacterium]
GWGEGDLGLRVTLNSKSPSPPPSPGVPTEGVAARDHEHVDALVRAASQFVARVPGDVGGTESGTALVTDFPWAAPSVRNALIALPGILLVAGRFAEVRSFLRSLYAKIDRGLVPSEFPESGAAPLYKACDTSLWWVHAVQQYLRYSGDADASLRPWLDAIDVIIESHHHGSAPGMTCDEDALLASRVPGCGTTWMDAKVGDWVVTPRASRPVELNALWYNALRFGAELHGRRGDALRAKEYADLAARVRESFNRRFWNDAEACCYDVVDDHGPDPSVRPNQLLAISLPFPVLDAARHAAVLDKVTRDLLTPRGVRTLSPHDPSYQGRYAGNVVSRDRAYHQGTAYPWLLGPLVSATLRVLGRGEKARQQARQLLAPCLRHLHEDGLGQLPELFDGDPPHRPGGATASARSVGELLRALVEEVFDQAPRPGSPAGGTLVDIVTVARPVPASPKP